MNIMIIYADNTVNNLSMVNTTIDKAIAKVNEIYHNNMFVDTVILYDVNDKELYRTEV